MPNKKYCVHLINPINLALFVFVVLALYAATASAAMYSPGQTLNPSCAPSATCDVYPLVGTSTIADDTLSWSVSSSAWVATSGFFRVSSSTGLAYLNGTLNATNLLISNTATTSVLAVTNGGLYLASSTPTSTTYALYNNNGTLLWNGKQVVSTSSQIYTGTTIGQLSYWTGSAWNPIPTAALQYSTTNGGLTMATTTVSSSTINGNALVLGTSTLATTSAAALTVTGTSTLSKISATNAILSGFLSVTGTSTLATTSITALAVSGTSTLAGISAANAILSGILSVSGVSTLATTSITALTVAGTSTLSKISATNAILSGILSVTGASTFATTTLASTTVTGLYASTNGLVIASSTPISTTNALYNLNSTLYWNGNQVISTSSQIYAGTLAGQTSYWTGSAWTATSSLFLSPSGYVGIGTTSPMNNLSLNGGLTIASTTPASTFQALYNNNGTLYWNGNEIKPTGTQGQVAYFSAVNNAVGTSSLFVSAAGNVGVGTATPDQALTIAGNVSNLITPNASLPIVGSISTGLTNGNSITVAGRYVYVANRSGPGSIAIYDVSKPSAPAFVSTTTTAADEPFLIAVSGRYAYLAHDISPGVVSIMDISNPISPIVLGSITIAGIVNGIAVSGRYVYAVDYNYKMYIIDVSRPTNPQIISTTTVPGALYSIFVSGRYAYITNGIAGGSISIVDVSNPSAPVVTGNGTVEAVSTSVFVSGRYAYVFNQASSTISVVDISNPAAPIQIATTSVGLNPNSIFVSGRYAFVSCDNGLTVVDISDPAAPTLITNLSVSGSLMSVSVSGRYAYSLATNNLSVIDITGAEFTSVMAHSLEAGNIQSRNDINAQGFINAGTALSVGAGGIRSDGALSVFSAAQGSTSVFTLSSASSVNILAALSNGFIGIGTTTPAYALTVNGSLGQNLFQIATSTNQNIFVVNSAGNVGLGRATNPDVTSKLSIYHNAATAAISIAADSASTTYLYASGAYLYLQSVGTSTATYFNSNTLGSSAELNIRTGGDFSIYTSNMSSRLLRAYYSGGNYYLNVNGILSPSSVSLQYAQDLTVGSFISPASYQYLCVNQVSAGQPYRLVDCNGSLRSLKENINLSPYGLNEIRLLQPVTFNSKENGKADMGMIAEDVELSVPQLATYDDSGKLTGVNYKQIPIYLIKATQDLYNLTFVTSSADLSGVTLENLMSQTGLSLSEKVSFIASTTSQMQSDLENIKSQLALSQGGQGGVNLSTLNQLTISGALSVGGHVALGKDTVGEATIAAGQTWVSVNFETPYNEKPIITLTPEGDNASELFYRLKNISALGFEIIINPTQETDTKFTWHAFAKKGEIFLSPTSTPTPTPAPMPCPSPSPFQGEGGGEVSLTPAPSPSPTADPTPTPEPSATPTSTPIEMPTPSATAEPMPTQ